MVEQAEKARGRIRPTFTRSSELLTKSEAVSMRLDVWRRTKSIQWIFGVSGCNLIGIVFLRT